MRFGFAKIDITPPVGLPMSGYAARSGVARGAADRLFCRVSVFGGKSGKACLCALDLLCVSREWTAPLRRAIGEALSCPAEAVLLAATHTHAGPAVFVPGRPEVLRRYEEDLAARVVEAAREAASRTVPVELFFGEEEVEGVATNRRSPHGFVDRTVRVLVARAANRTAGVLAQFSCHPTVLGPDNLRYSRDFFGAATDLAESALGSPVVLFNGAAGDASTRFARTDRSEREVLRLGEKLAEGIRAAAHRAHRVGGETLEAVAERVPLELSPRLSGGETGAGAGPEDAELARTLLATLGGPESLLGPPPWEAEILCLRLGGIDLLALGGEPLSELARRLRERRPRPWMLLGYANDYLGYFVPSELARPDAYETLVALADPSSVDRVFSRLAELGKKAS
ncbi:MAG: hypothetical protein KatS3mg076_2210 [Candidatus Binatia bacterium]|nr:MAG: hypothetical protein KatS3mg076_2210 [Candidatus Binatia bacterium]